MCTHLSTGVLLSVTYRTNMQLAIVKTEWMCYIEITKEITAHKVVNLEIMV